VLVNEFVKQRILYYMKNNERYEVVHELKLTPVMHEA